MKRLLSAAICALGLVAGCLTTERDEAPWRRQGLLASLPPGALDEALKDAKGDNMKMQDELPPEQRSSDPRPPTRPDW
jgi:hypothetical protein